MDKSRVRHWEGHGDLTVVEVERVEDPLDARGLEPGADTSCLLFSQGYLREGRFVARHYLFELDLTEIDEAPPLIAC